MTKEQDEVLRKITESNKIAEFAMNVLGMDERRAEVFQKACSDRFVWDGTLKFHGASGDVPADDPQCTGFFQREYDFLVPAKKVEGDAPTLDPDLIAKAKAGHMTAKSQLFRALHEGKPKGAEAETRAALDKLLAGDVPNSDRDAGGKFVPKGTGSNPWAAGSWNVTEQGRLVKALGEAKAAGIARAAGSFIGAVRPAKVA
jgi:hypothetical protein